MDIGETYRDDHGNRKCGKDYEQPGLPCVFAFYGQQEEEQCYRQIYRNEADGLHKY